ncbi:polysaccharide deacetylase family protein [Cryptosporangium sp. NPDC048952]|uniref:polysaccharide deacetylase family protein n=1 Tax=Cryptosporangium sp. NPDC048952 TaxID=3363961 RepID=UPI003715F515
MTKRLLAAFLAVTLLAAAGGGIWYYHHWKTFIGSKIPVSAVLSSTNSAFYSKFAGQAASAPTGWFADPVVLTYHDIGPNEQHSEYVVRPEAFAEQMQMLHLAGYRSLTAAQFVAYSQGTYTPPPRSVLITFDDGTGGLYRYADGILARYGFTAVSFLITGRVGTRLPYYLTWQQIDRMHSSGRWDFEDHTHDLHTQLTIRPGVIGSELSNRIPVDGSLETLSAYKQRVTADLDQSFRDFAAHGLPKPSLFAWPFSDIGQASPNDPEAVNFVKQQIQQRFELSFEDFAHHAQPATRSVLATKAVERLELTQSDTSRTLFDALQQMATLPVGGFSPTAVDSTWIQAGGARPAPLSVREGVITATDTTRKNVTADWAVQRTSMWSAYTVDARIDTIESPSVAASIRVRVGHGGEAAVSVSADRAAILVKNRTVVNVNIEPGPHDLRITVTPTKTVAWIDDELIGEVPAPADAAAARGGLGVDFGRPSADVTWPSIYELRVSEAS